MGMSASQARFLMLTGQKNNNEYQAQAISYERLQLSKYTEEATLEYNDKIQNRILLFQPTTATPDSTSSQRLTYEVITKDYSSGGLGMRVINKDGKIVVPGIPDPMYEGTTKDDYVLQTEIENPAYLENGLRTGLFFLEKRDAEAADGWSETAWQGNENIYDSLDTTDDAFAQSDYDEKMAKFQHQDKMLELQLKKLENEHKALETEIESVQKVIQKNVETSFKTFSA